MKRPLVAVVSCYIFGLLLGDFSQPPPWALFFVSFFTLIAALALKKFRPWLVWPLLALAGWTNLVSRMAVISPADLRSILGGDPALITVRGTLVETPATKIFLRDEQEVERSLARVRVARLRRAADSGWRPAFGTVVVTTPGVLPGSFFAGQPVEFSGVLAPPDAPRAEGLFDYRDHLKKLGIYYTLKTASPNDWRLGANALASPAWSDRFLGWARKTLTRGLDASDESTQLLLAMTLGEKTVLNDDIGYPKLFTGCERARRKCPRRRR